MSEFKFSCPHCQQNMSATPEYSGMQINCPACQNPIVVPAAPDGSAAHLGQQLVGVPQGGKSKLSMAASTVQHAATSPVQAAAQVRQVKKKQRWGLYAGLAGGAAVIVAGALLAPKVMDKYQEHKDAVAAQIAATNKPPPPPELTTAEILKKVDATYKGIKSYSAQAASVSTIDLSQVNPMLKDPQKLTAKMSILMARPNLYRFEWERAMGPKTLKGAIWSAGRGDYVKTASNPIKVKNRESAVTMGLASSGALGLGLSGLFFEETNKLETELKNDSKNADETLDGQQCYVLSGEIKSQDVTLWINRKNFLIDQIEVKLGGKIDDAALAKMNSYQKAQAQMMAKVRGNITETYSDVELNKDFRPEDFQSANTPTAAAPQEHKKRKVKLPGQQASAP